MSLFTLLEAARYLEYKSEASARGEEPHDYTTFTQLSAGGTTVPPAPATNNHGSNHGNSQNNTSNKDLGSDGSSVPNGINNCHGTINSTSASSSSSSNITSNSNNNYNGTGGSSNNHATLGGAIQHNHHQQQQQQHTNSNSSSSSNSPPLPLTLGTALGGGGGGGAATGPASLGGVLSTTSVTGSAGYRQRSGSAASRQRTDSLSSHDDSSRDPHNKQSRRSGGAGTREVHNKLEKNRRAHLKECFESLKKQLPNIQDDRKTSNLTILRSALRYIQNLKKKERDFEQQMEQLAREKISAQQRLATLRRDGSCVLPLYDNTSTNHNPHQIPHQSLSHHLLLHQQQQQQHSASLSLSTSSPAAAAAATTATGTVTTTTTATVTPVNNSREPSSSAPVGVLTSNTNHTAAAAGLGNIEVQRRTLLVTAGSSDRATEKLVANELKRRGSVSPDNETTTTASECGNLSDYEGDEFELVSHAGGQQQTLQTNNNNSNHTVSITTNSTLKRERDHHHHTHHHHHHRLGGTKMTTITTTAAAAAVVTAPVTTVATITTTANRSNGGLASLCTETDLSATVRMQSASTTVGGVTISAIHQDSSNSNKKLGDYSGGHATDVSAFNSLNNNAPLKRQSQFSNKEIKSVESIVVETKEECKPITISVTSGSGASVIATGPAVNPIYQQATAGLHKSARREIKEEPIERKSSLIGATGGAQLSNGLGAAGSASQAIAFVTTSTGTTAKTLAGNFETSTEGGQHLEVSPVTAAVSMEPPRAIFTPGNQKTVLPTYLPNTGNLATLLHAANTVSYIKAASAVNNTSGTAATPHGELTVTVSSAPMASVSSGGSSMVASVVPPTMVPSMSSSMVPSMGQIPLMCKPGSVVRLAASGHLVQPLTLVQQIPAAATAANGVTGGGGGSNGVAGKAGTVGSSQPTLAQAAGHPHGAQLFLAQTGPASGGAFKAAGTGVATPGNGQPVTSMATVITQAAPSQSAHHGAQIVAGVAPLGKVQLGGATATLSIKPVSQFPLISGQQFITTSSQSLKPVVVVSVPQTSTQ